MATTTDAKRAELKEAQDRLKGYKSGNQTPYTELKQTQLAAKIKRLRGEIKDAGADAVDESPES